MNCFADDGTLPKVLFYDIVQQPQRLAGLALVDMDNCYNQIADPMESMVFQSFGLPTSAIKSMLTTIQNMKSFLCTGYGRGSGGKNVIFSNGPNSTSKCSKLLY